MIQNPFSVNMGSFVVMKAVIIIISKGIAATLVKKPIRINPPQTISKTAVK